MKQIVSNYTYSPTANCVTLTGLNIDQDQLLLVVAPQAGRTLYNFASVTGTVIAGTDTRINLTASTAGLTTTSSLVIFYDDQLSAQSVFGTVTIGNTVPVSLTSVPTHGVTIASLPPSTVTVGNTVTINGTVTANVDQGSLISGIGDGINETNLGYAARLCGDPQPAAAIQIGTGEDPFNPVGINNPFYVSGTVTANGMLQVETDGIDVGTRGFVALVRDDVGSAVPLTQDGNGNLNVKINSGTVTIGSCVTHGVRLQDGSGNNLTSTSIGGVQRLNVSLASAATPGGTLPSFINIYGGTDGSLARTVLLDSSGRTVVTVPSLPASTVTVSALPSGALTTRFGSVTTANTAQITSAVTNTSRKYLLAQNISAGTVTIGIGFSPTTTQGIQLTAGAGLTFDAFCPTGAVYWLGAVTGAAFTILEG